MAQYPIGSRKDGGKILNGPETEGHRPGRGGGRGVPVLEKIFARLSLPSEAPFLLSPALILSSGRFCKRKEHKELALPGMVFVTDMTV